MREHAGRRENQEPQVIFVGRRHALPKKSYEHASRGEDPSATT